MRAGQLRQVLTFQQYAPGRDSFGEEIMIWADFFTCRGAIEPLSGMEQFMQKADQVVSIRSAKIRIRRRPDLDGLDITRLRIVHGSTGRIFDIQDIQFDPTLKREMVIVGEEKQREVE